MCLEVSLELVSLVSSPSLGSDTCEKLLIEDIFSVYLQNLNSMLFLADFIHYYNALLKIIEGILKYKGLLLAQKMTRKPIYLHSPYILIAMIIIVAIPKMIM